MVKGLLRCWALAPGAVASLPVSVSQVEMLLLWSSPALCLMAACVRVCRAKPRSSAAPGGLRVVCFLRNAAVSLARWVQPGGWLWISCPVVWVASL